MLKQFEQLVEKELPKQIDEPLILALSGGIDSMTLFHVLKSFERPFIVAHVNHKKRPESDHEFIEMKKLCEQANIPFEGTEFSDVPKGNFQKNARLFRQAFFKQIAQKHGARFILTAHHFDDLVETFLMRVLEGRSLSGLTPMKKATLSDHTFTFLKPLLDFNKDQIKTYADYWEIPYFSDKSNFTNRYTRNRIRHSVIPELEAINPNFKKTIKTTLEEIEDLNAFLESKIRNHPLFKESTLSLTTFKSFEPTMKRRFLRRKLQSYIPTLHPSKKFLDDIITQLETSKNFRMPLNEEYTLHKEYDVFHISEKTDNKPQKNPVLITRQGAYQIDDSSTLLVTDKKKTDTLTKPYVLWYNDDVYPLIMRTRENGDTIELPYGHKKISRLFIDRKIKPHKRDEMMLLTDVNKNVLWIPSLGIKKHGTKGSHCLYFYLFTDKTLSN